jgi:hypothetical protein
VNILTSVTPQGEKLLTAVVVLTSLYLVGSYIVVKAMHGKTEEKKEEKRIRAKLTPDSSLKVTSPFLCSGLPQRG